MNVELIVAVHALGYRVSESGCLTNPHGKALKVTTSGKYPRTGAWLDGKVKQFYVHHLAAFCFYGEEAFHAECIRHKDGDRLNISKRNVLIGTHVENEADKSPETRRRSAKAGADASAQRRPPDNGNKR
jgi:hypothetical protein